MRSNRVALPVAFAHAARTDGRKDLVRSQMSPGVQSHEVEQFYFKLWPTLKD